MKSKLISLWQYLAKHQFACFITLCIVIAIAMTGISLEIYKHSDAIKLDMSRPGYEKVRKQVEKSADDQPFDSNGTIDKRAIDDFENRMNKYQKELNSLGNYDSSTIDDENLGLTDSGERKLQEGSDQANSTDSQSGAQAQ